MHGPRIHRSSEAPFLPQCHPNTVRPYFPWFLSFLHFQEENISGHGRGESRAPSRRPCKARAPPRGRSRVHRSSGAPFSHHGPQEEALHGCGVRRERAPPAWGCGCLQPADENPCEYCDQTYSVFCILYCGLQYPILYSVVRRMRRRAPPAWGQLAACSQQMKTPVSTALQLQYSESYSDDTAASTAARLPYKYCTDIGVYAVLYRTLSCLLSLCRYFFHVQAIFLLLANARTALLLECML